MGTYSTKQKSNIFVRKKGPQSNPALFKNQITIYQWKAVKLMKVVSKFLGLGIITHYLHKMNGTVGVKIKLTLQV
jgi:hypothetical protein